MNSSSVTVLDLGSTKAVCLAACGDADGMRVEGVASAECKGIRRGVVSDLDDAAGAVERAVRRLEETTGRSVGGLVVGIAGAHVEGANAQGFVPIYPRSRLITREDVLQVINHSRQMMIPPDREQIQALPREFRIDGQRGVKRPVGMNGSRLEVVTYIVTGQVTHIQNIEKAVAMTGRHVEQMVLQSLASGLGVLTQEEIELGSAVIDIGGGTTDIAIFSGGSIAYSASLPVGGQLVTSDISKLLKTSPEEAERLKREHGGASGHTVGDKDSVDVMQLGQTQPRPLQRRVLCEIIESRMREIATMARQQIEKSGMYGLLTGGVVLTGGGSLLPGTDRLFEDVLRHLRVRCAEPHFGGAYSSASPPPGMATAVGLARYALQCGEDELAPAGAEGSWKDRIKTLFSVFGAKA